MLKKVILALSVCLGFTEVLPNKGYSFSSPGAGKVPTFSFWNMIKAFSSSLVSGQKSRCICNFLYGEYITGVINKRVTSYFFDLDDATAMKIGRKIAHFRQHRGNRLSKIRKIVKLNDIDLRFTPLKLLKNPCDDVTSDRYYKKRFKK